jgi:hypothetical protein
LDSSGETLNLNKSLLGIKAKLKGQNNSLFPDSNEFKMNSNMKGINDILNQKMVSPVFSIRVQHDKSGKKMNAQAQSSNLNKGFRINTMKNSGSNNSSIIRESPNSSIYSKKVPTPTISPLVSPGFVQRTSKFGNIQKR